MVHPVSSGVLLGSHSRHFRTAAETPEEPERDQQDGGADERAPVRLLGLAEHVGEKRGGKRRPMSRPSTWIARRPSAPAKREAPRISPDMHAFFATIDIRLDSYAPAARERRVAAPCAIKLRRRLFDEATEAEAAGSTTSANHIVPGSSPCPGGRP